MKKLLSLLAAVGLTTSASTAVFACNKNDAAEKPEEKTEEQQTTNNTISVLVDALKKEVQKVIQDQLLKIKSNLYKLDQLVNGQTSLKEKILNLPELKKIVGNSENGKMKKIDTLTNQQKILLLSDIKTIINWLGIVEAVKDVYNKEVYKVINYSENFDENFELSLNFDTLMASYNEISDNTVATVKVDCNYVVYYKDANNQRSQFNFINNFTYGLTSNKQTEEAVNKVIKSIRYAGVLDDKTYGDTFAFNNEKFKISEDKVNKPYTDNSYKTQLEDYINKTGKNEIIKKINDVFEKNTNFTFVEYNNSDYFFEEYKNIAKFEANKEYTPSTQKNGFLWKDEAKLEGKNYSSKQLYEFLFKGGQPENLNDLDVTINNKVIKVNNMIHDIAKESFKLNISDLYTNEVSKIKADAKNFGDTIYQDYTIDKLKTNKNLQNSMRLGYLTLNNLAIQVGGYKQLLPSFEVLTSYNQSESSDIESYNLASSGSSLNENFFKQSSLFHTIYNSLETGILARNKVYGFKTTDLQYDSYWSGKYRVKADGKSLANFNGTPASETGIKENMWTKMPKISNGNTAEGSQSMVNNILSLKYDSLSSYANYIKNTGLQDNYSWTFDFSAMHLETNDGHGISLLARGGMIVDKLKDVYSGNLVFDFANIKYAIDNQIYPNNNKDDATKYSWNITIISK
ncbi:hypothetical protein SHELI_v1c03760 [Spiroplasma helicoides]|uniref:Lipoprotein n=1 Tax=Spiroplasma helicoides TaxID=216938 RepID=A0A1B3SK75_9MOLU|nr:lipoprotein [Spiroplasma helicoides]AOG60329.1 hypothetical protein SHELI_v1c03760 [Spiroplasma helicoides]